MWTLFKTKSIPLILFTLAALVVVGVRVLRPLVVIRFGPLTSNRLGHFAANTEVYLSERDLGMHGHRIVDIFYHGAPVCNRQLANMWERVLHISTFAKFVDRLNRCIPGASSHVIFRRGHDRDINGILAITSPHLSFTDAEDEAGQFALRDLGIPDGAPFVCLHSRDSIYLSESYPELDLSHHDFRDSTIANFLPAAEELVRRGYYVIRTGAAVQEPLPESVPGVIDYATSGRSEFLDIYLGAKCAFYLGDSCGFHAIPMIFRRPVAIVNMVPLEYIPAWLANCPLILKKLWSITDNRTLTFKEILRSGAGKYLRSSQYQQTGIQLIENTPEEITAIAVEMVERLDGNWQSTDYDEALQRKFWALFKPNELNQTFVLRIGAEYLRQNADLLD